MEEDRRKNEENEDVGQNEGDTPDPETREGAAAAGGYNTRGPAPAEETEPALGVEPLARDPDGDIDSQADREGAGPFTGTGNQDALRTAGQPGATNANFADQRTSGDESAVKGDVTEDQQRRIDAAEQAEDNALDRDEGGADTSGGGAPNDSE